MTRWRGWIARLGPLDLVLLITLALLGLHVAGVVGGPIEVAMLFVVLAAAVSRRARGHPATWFVLTALLAASVARAWLLVDNHKFLLVYWSLAVACSFTTRAPGRALALSGRVLIGLCFALATVWKLVSPDFLDGRSLRFLMLEDVRFAPVADRLGAMSAEVRAHNHAAHASVIGGDAGASAALRGGPQLATIATLLAWWTVVIEAAVAVTFLAPARWAVARARDAALLVFIATTYALAPVPGFAWLLIAMGLASTASKPDAWRPRARLAYAAALLLTQLYFAIFELSRRAG